ncbi:uncharacterized protein DNG_02170 [Cephalotrichum gorgonifer]|uniref:Uncharacterized protein n=1 Tax=Cephalotrichum gorgonifer TaxID=2041049 RepID=A0AAE8SSU9_9PEZI|nr:uncharacterized protein DNG_02170 [Cephalotrichum gorgonifer]
MHFQITFTLISLLLPIITASPIDDPPEVGSACGAELGDCPSLTCIPLSKNCTDFSACPGTCQEIVLEDQRIYTLCGGWGFYDDCDETIEYCRSDPRTTDLCGPSCDGFGICAVSDDYCGGESGRKCGEGKVCFNGISERWFPGVEHEPCSEDEDAEGLVCAGMCFPLRFGYDGYEKSMNEILVKTDEEEEQIEPPEDKEGRKS